MFGRVLESPPDRVRKTYEMGRGVLSCADLRPKREWAFLENHSLVEVDCHPGHRQVVLHVGSGTCSPPRHQTHLTPSCVELDGIP